MAANFTVRVTGLKELAAGARRAKDVALPAALRGANRMIADRVAEDAAQHAPRRSGRLAASVKGRASATSASVVAGSPQRVPYAAAVHWGWPKHNIASNPFLKNAADRAEADIEEYYAVVAAKVADAV